MERMKTFFTYALLIIGFFVLSLFLENGLLKAMYSEISGAINENFTAANGQFSIEKFSATASNTNGYISFDFVNTTGKLIDKCYIKLDLYNKQNLLATTKYIEILSMQPGESRKINVKFKANNVERYNISIVETLPDKTNIINILGWEIDLTNVFGLGIDLSNVSIFGRKLTDIFSWNNIKSTGKGFWSWFSITAKGVPAWAYFIGWMFIVGLL